jgi:hypothetical protein
MREAPTHLPYPPSQKKTKTNKHQTLTRKIFVTPTINSLEEIPLPRSWKNETFPIELYVSP